MRRSALILALFLSVPAFAAEPDEVTALKKRIEALELDKLKLRLNLADEKIVNSRMEFNMLFMDRQRICDELAGRDPKFHAERCKENK